MRFFKKTFVCEVKKHKVIDSAIKGQILDLFSDWVDDKGGDISTDYYQREYLALSRFLNASESIDFLIVAIYFGEKLIAVSISESVKEIYQVGHFQKSLSLTYKGLGAFLEHEEVAVLAQNGIKYFNWEQDMGIEGLRAYKLSYQPERFLKKYEIMAI